MKKLISLMIALCLSLFIVSFSFAVDCEYLIDNADLLSEDEEILLLSEIEEFIYSNGFDVVIHTTPDTDGKAVYEYAEDFYDNGGYSSDGLIFVISMQERDYYTSTCGSLVDSLPDYAIDSLCEPVVPCLSDGNYYKAFSVYLSQINYYINNDWHIGNDDSFVFAGDYYADEYIYEGSYEDDYQYESNASSSSNVFIRELILVVIAVVVALIITSILKSMMNTVVKKHDADDYVVPGTFRLDLRHDLFIGSSVTRRPLPKNNNNNSRPGGGGGVRMSSGGVRHGGSGGKF